MVPSPPEAAKTGGLPVRILSSLLMIPAMLAVIYAGAPVFDVAIAAVAAALIWEWQGLLAPRAGLMRGVAIAGTVAAVAAAAFGWGYGLACAAVAAMAVGVLARRRTGVDLALLCLGPLYVAAPCLAVLALRHGYGFGVTAGMFAMVWATDIGGYAFGRGIGGPKLAPRVSPNKTWAGLAGGMACSAAAGAILAALDVFPGAGVAATALFGAALAVVAQAGDLFESAVKRRVGAKDSSRLI
ncbi:MAG: phosphatidate cytidylyltransferase, partial [Rhodospirillaceae bacterium]